MRLQLFLSVMGILALSSRNECCSQQINKRFTFNEVIGLAKNQSPDAILARHHFRSSYWEYRSFRAELLPELTASTGIVNFNRSFIKYEKEDGTFSYPEVNTNSSMLNLSLLQNISLTGGEIFINSNLERNDIFGGNTSTSYLSAPVRIGLRQPMGYNPYRWSKKIEPLKYEAAKKTYISNLEQVSLKAVQYFFDLALAQLNLEIAKTNYANTDTLYKIAKGRYNIGTIAEDDLLQMELTFLNAGTSLNESMLELEMKKFQLRSFLGFNGMVNIELEIPRQIPRLEIEVGKALDLSKSNNPDVLSFERQLLEARQNVARSKSAKNLTATLYASYGLTQNDTTLPGVYKNPLSQQQFNIGLEVPLLDWGQRKGKYKMARSNQEIVMTSVEQAKVDFEQEIFLQVMQFNMQDDQVNIAAKADTVANLRYEVTKQRFLIGKINVLDLNVALSEKDVAKRSYLSALKNYWVYFYTIRRLTLFDFENNAPLTENYTDLTR